MPTKTNGYSFAKQRQRRDKRHDEADKRNAKYSALTTQQKIARAKTRPGNSKRELERLTRQHERESVVKEKVVSTPDSSPVVPVEQKNTNKPVKDSSKVKKQRVKKVSTTSK